MGYAADAPVTHATRFSKFSTVAPAGLPPPTSSGRRPPFPPESSSALISSRVPNFGIENCHQFVMIRLYNVIMFISKHVKPKQYDGIKLYVTLYIATKCHTLLRFFPKIRIYIRRRYIRRCRFKDSSYVMLAAFRKINKHIFYMANK